MARPKKMPFIEVVKADIEAGMPNLDMAAKYHVGKSAVTDFLKRHDLRRKPKSATPALADVAACVQKRMTCAQIAAELGGNADSISRMIVRHGLRDRLPSEVMETSTDRVPQAGPTKIVNARGISLPRIICVYGKFEGRP